MTAHNSNAKVRSSTATVQIATGVMLPTELLSDWLLSLGDNVGLFH